MEPRCFLVLFCSVMMCPAAAPEQGAARLRSLAELPSVTMTLQITSTEAQHPERMLGRNELKRRVQDLSAELKQNPRNGTTWHELARYATALDRKEEARAAYTNAAERLRLRVQETPHDLNIQALFADALWSPSNPSASALRSRSIGKPEEAEHVFRNITKTAPDAWLGWVRLADFLWGQCSSAFFKSATHAGPGGTYELAGLAERLKRFPPSANEWEESLRLRTEAQACLGRALKLAPQEPEVLLARAMEQSVYATFGWIVEQARHGATFGYLEFMKQVSSEEACIAWADVARRSPTNYAAIGYWGWLEALPGMLPPQAHNVLDSLSDKRRQNVLEAMRLLEKFTEAGNPLQVAGACETFGILRFMVTQERGALATMRRAIGSIGTVRSNSAAA